MSFTGPFGVIQLLLFAFIATAGASDIGWSSASVHSVSFTKVDQMMDVSFYASYDLVHADVVVPSGGALLPAGKNASILLWPNSTITLSFIDVYNLASQQIGGVDYLAIRYRYSHNANWLSAFDHASSVDRVITESYDHRISTWTMTLNIGQENFDLSPNQIIQPTLMLGIVEDAYIDPSVDGEVKVLYDATATHYEIAATATKPDSLVSEIYHGLLAFNQSMDFESPMVTQFTVPEVADAIYSVSVTPVLTVSQQDSTLSPPTKRVQVKLASSMTSQSSQVSTRWIAGDRANMWYGTKDSGAASAFYNLTCLYGGGGQTVTPVLSTGIRQSPSNGNAPDYHLVWINGMDCYDLPSHLYQLEMLDMIEWDPYEAGFWNAQKPSMFMCPTDTYLVQMQHRDYQWTSGVYMYCAKLFQIVNGISRPQRWGSTFQLQTYVRDGASQAMLCPWNDGFRSYFIGLATQGSNHRPSDMQSVICALIAND